MTIHLLPMTILAIASHLPLHIEIIGAQGVVVISRVGRQGSGLVLRQELRLDMRPVEGQRRHSNSPPSPPLRQVGVAGTAGRKMEKGHLRVRVRGMRAQGSALLIDGKV